MDAASLDSVADTFILARWGVRLAGTLGSALIGGGVAALITRFHPHYYRKQRIALLAFLAIVAAGMTGVTIMNDNWLIREATGLGREQICANVAGLLVRDRDSSILRTMERFGCSGGYVLEASDKRIAELVAKAGKDYADELEARRLKAVKARFEALMASHDKVLPDDLDAVLSMEAEATHRPVVAVMVPLEFALLEVSSMVRPADFNGGLPEAVKSIGGRMVVKAALTISTARTTPYITHRAVPGVKTCAEAGHPHGCAVTGGKVYATSIEATFSAAVDDDGTPRLDWDVGAYPKDGGTAIRATGEVEASPGTVRVIPLEGGPLDARLVLLLKAGKTAVRAPAPSR